MASVDVTETESERSSRLRAQLDRAIERLARAGRFAKSTQRGQVLDVSRRLLQLDAGVDYLYARAGELDRAGVFAGTDWERPEILQPTLASGSIAYGDSESAVLESLSELRLLAVANGAFLHDSVTSEQAHHYLAQVLALNLGALVSSGASEADREHARTREQVFQYLVEHIGYEDIFESLVSEMWRILSQRPISVEKVKRMVTQVAAHLYGEGGSDVGGPAQGSAARLVAALYGPSRACQEDPGLDEYRARLATLDANGRSSEASGLARAMHDTGLVSPYHAVFLRFALDEAPSLLADSLGLSTTGRDCMLCYSQLVDRLIRDGIFPETAQAIYGLSLLLERGTLYAPPVAPALWRQIELQIGPEAEALLKQAFHSTLPARTVLLAGVLSVLGQPLGIGQGNNPTCQAARALSMWAHNDPSYLLQLLAWAARDGNIDMYFEGESISSREAGAGLAATPPVDVDPVSVVVVPHLDRVYMEMGRRCAGRDGDPHQWINPEFHGWWVGRGTALAVDISTGKLNDFEGFTRRFYSHYHPFFNGNMPVIHLQPAGIAVTDSAGRFVGWHAITIMRVALDQSGTVRVYFYNPNNDSGQDWGGGVVVSTEGNGEHYGEGSLPITEFASRLYLFHYDPAEHGDPDRVPADAVARVGELARASWGANR